MSHGMWNSVGFTPNRIQSDMADQSDWKAPWWRADPTVGMADSDSRCGPRIRFGGVITRSNPGQVRPLLCHPFCSFLLSGFRTPVRKCRGCESLVQDHSKKAKAHADTCAGLVAIGLWKTPVNPIAVVPRSGGPSATVQAVARQV